MLPDVNEPGRSPEQARRARGPRRFLVFTLVLALATGGWFSRDGWLPAITADSPYDATPAANFADGEAGIVMPEARATQDISAEQVAKALGKVRQALIAAYLDNRMLIEHDPTPVLQLLAPDSARAVLPRFEAGQYGTALVQLDKGSKLAATPKVSGWTSYARVNWNGLRTLEVTTNYVVAYAFAQPSGVVVLHAETHWMFPFDDDLRPSSRGMYLGRTTGYWHGMDCGKAALGITAPAPARDRHADPNFRDEDTLDAYYDPNRPVDVNSGCR